MMPRSPGSPSSRARRCSSCRSTCCATSGPSRRLAGARLRPADRSGAPAVPRGPVGLPLPRAGASSSGAPAGGRGHVEARRPRRPRARPEAPSRSCIRRSGWRSRARSRCGSTSSWAPAGTTDRGTGASGRPASCSRRTESRRRGVGRGPLRALAAGGVRRAAVPRHRRARDALALGQRADAREFEAALRARPSRRCRRGGTRRHRHARARAHPALARRALQTAG